MVTILLFRWPLDLLIYSGLSRCCTARGSSIKLLGSVKYVAKMVVRCLRMSKVAIFVVWDLKWCLVKYEKYGTLSIYYVTQRGEGGVFLSVLLGNISITDEREWVKIGIAKFMNGNFVILISTDLKFLSMNIPLKVFPFNDNVPDDKQGCQIIRKFLHYIKN